MSAATHFPEIVSLSPEECAAVLLRNHVGRAAFSFQDRVDIHPVHYVFANGWIYIRTSEGEKLTTMKHHPWIAFEVDEVAGPFEWVSVVARGGIYRIDSGAERPDPDADAEAIAVLRAVVPTMFTAADPVPHRHVLLRMAVKEVSGRQSHPTWNPGGAPRDAAAY